MAKVSGTPTVKGYPSWTSSPWFCFATISPAYNTIVETIVRDNYKYS